jgi:hypothetical protein
MVALPSQEFGPPEIPARFNFEQELFLDQVSIGAGSFDKIVLLDPRNATRAFQVFP